MKESVQWPAGVKKTKQRLLVYAVLEGTVSPLSAMEIFRQLEGEKPAFWLSTVYRVLDLFVREGLVVKTTVMDNSMALYELNRHLHRHYAICMGCHKVIEMDNCPMETFEPKLADGDFRVLGHKLEMYGYCRDCDRIEGDKR